MKRGACCVGLSARGAMQLLLPVDAATNNSSSGPLMPLRVQEQCRHRAEFVRVASGRAMESSMYRRWGRDSRMDVVSPELASEWDTDKNPPHRFPALLAASDIHLYWWKCRFCQHSFEMSPEKRYLRGGCCPVCKSDAENAHQESVKKLAATKPPTAANGDFFALPATGTSLFEDGDDDPRVLGSSPTMLMSDQPQSTDHSDHKMKDGEDSDRGTGPRRSTTGRDSVDLLPGEIRHKALRGKSRSFAHPFGSKERAYGREP